VTAGTWAAPGRVNLIGEHVDYAEGLCLPFAIAERTVVTAAPRADELLTVQSSAADDGQPDDVTVALDAVGPGSPSGWAGYVAGVLWALRSAGHAVGGLDVHVTETVPLGAGLSSSAALECAVGGLRGRPGRGVLGARLLGGRPGGRVDAGRSGHGPARSSRLRRAGGRASPVRPTGTTGPGCAAPGTSGS
jgi:galactokinase